MHKLTSLSLCDNAWLVFIYFRDNLCGEFQGCCRRENIIQQSGTKPQSTPFYTSTESSESTSDVLSSLQDFFENAVEEVDSYNYPQGTNNKSSEDYQIKFCGVRNIKIGNRIKFIDEHEDSDNRISEFAEFPWTLALYERSYNGDFSYKCGAVLVSETIVLTAAHCTTNFKNNPENYLIRAGDWNREKTIEKVGHQERIASKIIRHPDYYSGSLFNDIAVIEVDRPFDETYENVQRICVDENAKFNERDCIISGWGGSASNNVDQAVQGYLKMPLIERHTCETELQRSRLGKRFKLHENFLCAGGEYGRDFCKGSGGKNNKIKKKKIFRYLFYYFTGSPLVCQKPDGTYNLVGISSWSIGCGEGMPNVFVNVLNMANWIRKTMIQIRSGDNEERHFFV